MCFVPTTDTRTLDELNPQEVADRAGVTLDDAFAQLNPIELVLEALADPEGYIDRELAAREVALDADDAAAFLTAMLRITTPLAALA